MFIKRASCPHCRHCLPLDAKFYQFKLPPRTIACENCHKEVPTTYEYRVNWIANTFFRLSFIGVGTCVFFNRFMGGVSFISSIIVASFAGLLVGGVVSAIAGFFLAPILQLFLEAGHVTKKGAQLAMDAASKSKGGLSGEDERLLKHIGSAPEPKVRGEKADSEHQKS